MPDQSSASALPASHNTPKDALTPARCPQCGAKLSVDRQKDAAICDHCGMPFIVQKAIRNYAVNTPKAKIRLTKASVNMSQLEKAFEEMGEAFEIGQQKAIKRDEEERGINDTSRTGILVLEIIFLILLICGIMLAH